MEENNKSGFSAEGRKLRPRRPRVTSKVWSSNEGPSERRTYNSDERRHESSERRSYGHSAGSDRSYGHSDYGRSYDRPSSYGHSSEGRGYGNSGRRSYGDNDGRSYGNHERRSYGDSDRRGYGDSERRPYNSAPSGRRATYGPSERPSGRRAYGDNAYDGETRENRGGRPSAPSGRRAFNGGRNNGNNSRNNFKGGKPAAKKNSDPRANSRKQAAKRAQARPNPYKFNEADEQSINQILSRKPQLDQIQLSDNDYVEIPAKETIRLNKFIANSGICSRREADQYIQAGVVTVNGEVISELGTKVNVFTDDVRFNGERIRGEEKVYIVMNKPKGFVTTASDPHADKTVMDLLKNCSARVFPVGRLDKNTTGVLMFTNDGEMAERLTHPSYDKKKIYQVILDKPISQEDFDKVVNGITLADGDIKADELEYIDNEDHRKLGIEIHSGKNRIVRRIFESLGYDVKALDRVYFAGLTKKGLKKGEWRFLSEGETNVLKMGAYV